MINIYGYTGPFIAVLVSVIAAGIYALYSLISLIIFRNVNPKEHLANSPVYSTDDLYGTINSTGPLINIKDTSPINTNWNTEYSTYDISELTNTDPTKSGPIVGIKNTTPINTNWNTEYSVNDIPELNKSLAPQTTKIAKNTVQDINTNYELIPLSEPTTHRLLTGLDTRAKVVNYNSNYNPDEDIPALDKSLAPQSINVNDWKNIDYNSNYNPDDAPVLDKSLAPKTINVNDWKNIDYNSDYNPNSVDALDKSLAPKSIDVYKPSRLMNGNIDYNPDDVEVIPKGDPNSFIMKKSDLDSLSLDQLIASILPQNQITLAKK